jgi:uncharacterized membrane protein
MSQNRSQNGRQNGHWSEGRIERAIGRTLQIGVLLSALIVAAGGTWFLVKYGGTMPDYRQFRGEPDALRKLPLIPVSAAHGSARGLIQLGLLVLIATPVLRVAFMVFVFLKQGDRLYAGFALLVLAVLGYALFGPPLV